MASAAILATAEAEGVESPEAYARGTARHLAADHFRACERLQPLVDVFPAAPEDPARGVVAALVLQKIVTAGELEFSLDCREDRRAAARARGLSEQQARTLERKINQRIKAFTDGAEYRSAADQQAVWYREPADHHEVNPDSEGTDAAACCRGCGAVTWRGMPPQKVKAKHADGCARPPSKLDDPAWRPAQLKVIEKARREYMVAISDEMRRATHA